MGWVNKQNRANEDFDPADYADILDRYDPVRYAQEAPASLIAAVAAAPAPPPVEDAYTVRWGVRGLTHADGQPAG